MQQSLHETGLRVTSHAVTNEIGSPKKYAATVHQGSKPHVIRSRKGMLKFRWERGNLLLERRRGRKRQFFFFDSVRHPGNKRPTRYLTTPLAQFGRLNGFRTITSAPGRSRLP